MNPHAPPRASFVALAGALWRNRELIGQMARREVVGRYRGSMLGIAWSLFHPLLMLAVYTFVFSVVFPSRWGTAVAGAAPEGGSGRMQFAIVLFAGMIVHALFAEVLNRAPGLVVGNVNFVKKVVFPLEILPAVTAGAALFHALVSLLVLLGGVAVCTGAVPWTAVFVPLVLLPLVVLTLGFAWLLASLGVYLRDVGQTIGILTAVLMFLSPVFYPVASLPPPLRPLILVNPLTFIMEQARDVLIWGRAPDFAGLGVYLAAACFVAWAGFAWFQRTRKGFGDVL
jgi:lipopolysaccharide transport system permease protein